MPFSLCVPAFLLKYLVKAFFCKRKGLKKQVYFLQLKLYLLFY